MTMIFYAWLVGQIYDILEMQRTIAPPMMYQP